MAEDSRDPSSSQSSPDKNQKTDTSVTGRKQPKHEFPQSQVGKLWDAFGDPEERVNVLANATYKPTGKNPKDATYSEVIGTMSLSGMSSFYKAPCARESLMTGIGAGFGIGGIRGIFGGMHSLWSAGNWAVGVFAVTSLAAYEFCRRRRIQELNGMKEAVELMKELKLKKQREKEKAADEAAMRQRFAEEERKKKNWTNLSNYKFW